jgi:hypothetical protein
VLNASLAPLAAAVIPQYVAALQQLGLHVQLYVTGRVGEVTSAAAAAMIMCAVLSCSATWGMVVLQHVSLRASCFLQVRVVFGMWQTAKLLLQRCYVVLCWSALCQCFAGLKCMWCNHTADLAAYHAFCLLQGPCSLDTPLDMHSVGWCDAGCATPPYQLIDVYGSLKALESSAHSVSHGALQLYVNTM